MKTKLSLFLFLISFSALVSFTNAQTYRKSIYGDIYGGLTIASMNKTGNDSFDKNRFGFMVGGNANIKIYKQLLLQTGVQFVKKGSIKHENRIEDLEGPMLKIDVKQTLDANYIQVPLALGFEIPITKEWSVNMSAGGFAAYGFRGKIKQKGYNVMIQNGEYLEQVSLDENPRETFSNTALNKWDYGLTGSVELVYDIFLLRLQYDHGLADVATEPFNRKYKTESWKTRNFAICLGFRL